MKPYTYRHILTNNWYEVYAENPKSAVIAFRNLGFNVKKSDLFQGKLAYPRFD